jgi:cytochrome c553
MKKITILVALLGLTASLSVKAADGKELWDSQCAKCHGAEGKGDTKMGTKLGCKDLSDAKVQGELKDEAITKSIKEGVKADDGKTLMKPFDQLSDDDIKALSTYIRSLKK